MALSSLRIINVECLRHPRGWFLVSMDQDTADEYSAVWESSELAFADADRLKRSYGPAAIRDRTGGVS